MNHKKQMVLSLSILPALLFSSCASSERIGRMSGAIQSYRKPSPARIQQFSPSCQPHKSETIAGINDTLINLWPFFYRGNDYISILWPMIDKDPYGFAVRPFYNQEGNEYSILFPLCAWNPVNRDGWIANGYWNKENSGMIPFFHHNRNSSRFSFYGPVWMRGNSYGFFPLTRHSPDLNYAGPAWWNYENEKIQSGGFFPIARFSPDFNYAGPAWWNYENEKIQSGGFFPIARFSPDFNYAGPAWWNYENEKIKSGGFFPILRLSKDDNLQNIGPVWWFPGASYGVFPIARITDHTSFVGPVWWDRPRSTFGVAPMFCYRDAGNNFLLPLYFLADDGQFFLSPIAAWDKDNMISILGPMYIGKNDTQTYPPDCNPMCSWGIPREKSYFRMYALLAFHGGVTSYQWSRDVELNELRETGIDKIRNPAFLRYKLNLLGYRGDLPQNKEELKKLKTELKQFVKKQDSRYYCFLPLFYYDDSTEKRLLISPLPYYSKSDDSESSGILGGLLFMDHTNNFSKKFFSATLSKHNPKAVRERSITLFPLLTHFKQQEFYQESEALQAARTLHEIKYSAEKRDVVNAELKKLNPNLSLPKTVQEQEAYRDFLTRTVSDRKLKTESFLEGGCIPLLIRTENSRSATWISPALLTGFTTSKADGEWSGGFAPVFLKLRQKNSIVWISPALLSGFQTSDNGFSFRSVPLLTIRERKEETKNSFLPLVNPSRIFEEKNPISEFWSSYLLGLYHTSEKEFFTAKNPAENTLIQTLRSDIQQRIHLLKKQENLEKNQKLHKTDKPSVRERFAASQKANEKALEQSGADLKKAFRTLNLPAEPDLSSTSALESRLNALYADKIRKRKVISYGTWGFRYAESEKDYQWSIARFLAYGSSIGEVKETKVLRYLYSSRTEGKKSQTMFFPFVLIQKNGADSRRSFLWRVLERREINGKTGGYIFFIPYGE